MRKSAIVLMVWAVAAAVVVAVPSSATAQNWRDEVAKRDQLIAAQENLLNAYRCRFQVDIGAVKGGCSGGQPGATGLSRAGATVCERGRLGRPRQPDSGAGEPVERVPMPVQHRRWTGARRVLARRQRQRGRRDAVHRPQRIRRLQRRGPPSGVQAAGVGQPGVAVVLDGHGASLRAEGLPLHDHQRRPLRLQG